MLKVCPKDRISAQEALLHHFFSPLPSQVYQLSDGRQQSREAMLELEKLQLVITRYRHPQNEPNYEMGSGILQRSVFLFLTLHFLECVGCCSVAAHVVGKQNIPGSVPGLRGGKEPSCKCWKPTTKQHQHDWARRTWNLHPAIVGHNQCLRLAATISHTIEKMLKTRCIYSTWQPSIQFWTGPHGSESLFRAPGVKLKPEACDLFTPYKKSQHQVGSSKFW
ncbi:Cyclin-dependent kinase 15, partial [Varanus komodoensis]